jgi:hypothetical protein
MPGSELCESLAPSLRQLDRPPDRPRNSCRVETSIERGDALLQQSVDPSDFTSKIRRRERQR